LLKETTESQFLQTVDRNVPLAPLTTLGVGGPAKYFAEVTSASGLVAAVAWADAGALPLFVLGGGSNIVVSDAGFDGLVLRVAIAGIDVSLADGQATLVAGAGEEWDSLVAMTVENNWAGFECLSGIPGRVGATPIQNVGAYGRETSETLVELEALDLRTRRIVRLAASECEFGYRASRFKARDRDRFIITSVTYRLEAGGKPVIRYPELKRYLAYNGADAASLPEVRRAVIAIRKRKAMVIDPEDADSRSVGSFFMNPVVTQELFEEVRRRAAGAVSDGGEMPAFAAPDDRVKLSAAWLIERAGITRGYVYGNVGTSTKHALAIINRGGGTAREVVELADHIRRRVLDTFGLELKPEPVFVGFDS
jgi:UDP-N-acetylmuramate dehydrogenase